VTLTWNGKRFDWVNVGWFAAIHAGVLFAPWTFTWTGLAVALVLWWLVGSIGICLTYHRLLTHRGFTLSKPLEYLGTVAGMLASEGGAISWVAMHRIHHANSDQPRKDVHTPKDGFIWSHIGWILTKLGVDYREMERRWAPELVADPVHRVLNRLHWVPNVVLGLAFYAWGGWSLVVWGMSVRLVLTLHGTHLGLPHLGDEGGLAQPLVGGARRLGRGLAQHAPRLPALGTPWLRLGARPDLARDPRPRRAGPGARHPPAAAERRALPHRARSGRARADRRLAIA